MWLRGHNLTGDGLRAQKTNNSGTSFFLYDGDQPVMKISGSGTNIGTITLVSTYGANGLVSRSSVSGSTVTPTFYSFDPQGGVSHRTDSTGAMVSADEYDAFGNLLRGLLALQGRERLYYRWFQAHYDHQNARLQTY